MDYFVDTHAHLYSSDFNEDRDDMIKRGFDAGVTKMFMPNVDRESISGMMEVESKYPGKCMSMMGLHPCSVKADFQKELYIVEEWLSKRKFCAVGEMGTDLYWDKTFWEQQKEAFVIQARWAIQYDLPLVIHSRESIDETIELLSPMMVPKLRGIFHCFTGSVEQANKIIEMGFLLGIGGVSTFKNGGLDKVLPGLPLSSLVLETDSPYLAPVPFRGKRNEPSYIPMIADRVSSIMGIPLSTVKETTTLNALRIFVETE